MVWFIGFIFVIVIAFFISLFREPINKYERSEKLEYGRNEKQEKGSNDYKNDESIKKKNSKFSYYKPPIIYENDPCSTFDDFIDTLQKYENDVQYTVKKYNIQIRGLYYLSKSEQNRARDLFNNDELYLERDYNNPKDKFAIKVKTWDGYHIGFVQTPINKTIYKALDDCIEVRVFMYNAGFGEIPYQYGVIYCIKDKLAKKKIIIPKKDADTDEKVCLIDYQVEVQKLKLNIRNCEKSAQKMREKGKLKLEQNALKRKEMYENELERINKMKESLGITSL